LKLEIEQKRALIEDMKAEIEQKKDLIVGLEDQLTQLDEESERVKLAISEREAQI